MRLSLRRLALSRIRSRQRAKGQALVEFAVVAPVLFLVIAGIIQFGLIFWSQQTITQIARDTGRWAATQDCTADVLKAANDVAEVSTLFGYSSWDSSNVTASWSRDQASHSCPPKDNTEGVWVTVDIKHQIPVFFPLVPGNGNLSTSAEFRMEPKAQ